MTDLLSVRDLSVIFKLSGTEIQAVRKISFALKSGETLALVGESGSGKSVTALSILQLLPYPLARHLKGSSIRFREAELLGAPESLLQSIRGNRIAMVFQEPMTSLNPLHTIGRQVSESSMIHKGLSRSQANRQTLELLHLVGLAEAKRRLDAYPHELSGGQRQRVMIAMALANEPDLLIADEPTTALDVTIQAQILNLLKDLQRRFNMALLLITHDLGVVRKMANRVCVMNDGEIVEQATVTDLFERPAHPYTQRLLASEPKGRSAPPRPGALEVLATEDIKVHFPIRKGLFRRTVDCIRAVDGISLQVRAGQTLGVVGESGSGKTTLGMAALRLTHSEGIIRFDGTEIQDWSSRRLRPLRRQMQLVFQDPFGSLSPRLSVGDIIAEGLRIHHPEQSLAEREAVILKALDEVGLDADMRYRYPHEFSGGQRQRVAIARAMVLKPRLVVLDEPTSALDMSVQTQIIELLRNLQARHGLAYLFISHDLKVIRALSNEVIVMKDGQVIERGPTESLFTAPREAYTRALLAAALDLETLGDATPRDSTGGP